MLRTELSAGLDAAFLSATAGSTSAHAGLLYGLSATAASTSGAREDLSALASSVASGGSGDVVFIAEPALVARLRIVEPQLAASIDIVPSASLPAGRVVAVDPRAIITAVDKEPDLFVSKESNLHMGDVPLELVTAGGTVADPHRSLWQTDSVALRITQSIAFKATRSSAAAFVDGAVWA